MYGSLALATLGALGLSAALAPLPAAAAPPGHHARIEAAHHKRKHKRPSKQKGKDSSHPCLEGSWSVTSLTLSTSGLSFTGGAGTTVDITSNGNAVGDFTPGTPLVGSEGSAKFSGTLTDHYGFPPDTTATSGSFAVTPVSNSATITVGGVTKPVSSESEQGSYTCSGKDLSLTFTSSGSTLTYQMAPTG